MRTAASWAEPLVDTGVLLRFRLATGGGGTRARVGLGAALLLTVAVVVVPPLTPGAGGAGTAFELLLLLPTVYVGFLLLAVLAAATSGGGRELMPGDTGVAYPVSPVTDHLGALLLAPLNIGWIIQAWLVLGATTYAVGWRTALVGAVPVLLLWIAVGTALGQLVAWGIELLRRLPHGVTASRLLAVVLAGAVAALVLAGRLGDVLDAMPTSHLALAVVEVGGWPGGHWWAVVGVEVALLVGAVVGGGVLATAASRRGARDAAAADSRHYPAAPTPGSDLAMLLRLDRASVWRAVPMRRGIAVLAAGPGLVALLGGLEWREAMLLPGLVAAGGALLFGVNAWCLDGRGALWRESLPVAASTVFAARSWVLVEMLLLASGGTVLLAAVRAGTPTAGELAAVLVTWLVVCAQVVAASMQWSGRRPHAVDLRSARATPAPPALMLGYSARLALVTTLTGMVLSGLGSLGVWWAPVVLGVPLLLLALRRWASARAAWLDAPRRAVVVTTVAA